MLGPVSSVASSARRRARRRARLIFLVAIVLAFVIGELVNEVVNDRTATASRSAKTWVTAVESSINDANAQSVELNFVMTKGAKMARPQLIDILSELVSSASSEETSVATLDLAAPTGTATSTLAHSLSIRRRAIADFRQAILDAISNGNTSKSHHEMLQAGNLLRNAVAAYNRFLRGLPHSANASVLPLASWAKPASLWNSHALATFGQQLSTAPQLKARNSLSISDISLNPLPEIIPTTTTTTVIVPTSSSVSTSSPNFGASSTSTTIKTSAGKRPTTTTTTTTTLAPISQIPSANVPSVIAPTSTLTVIVVVANSGNVGETNLRVSARLAGQVVTSPSIASLDPGRSRYIRLRSLGVRTSSMAVCGSKALHQDRCATLRVSLTASSGATANRQVLLAFFVG